MRLLRLILLPSVQSLAISPIASEASLFGVLPSNSNISSNNSNITSNNTHSLNEDQVICKATDPHFYPIELDFCGPAISIACRQIQFMAATHEGQGSWNWVTLEPEAKCVAGFYVPLEARPWMFPSLNECHKAIFRHILDVCGRYEEFNIGTINIDRLPDSSTPGTAILDGYPRYLMASMTL